MAERPLSEKMRRVLLAILELQEEGRRASANTIADHCGYMPTMARTGRSGRGHGSRVMGTAVHVNTALTALGRRGLVRPAPDYAFGLTDAGRREALAAREAGLDTNAARAEGKTTQEQRDAEILGRHRG